MSLTPEPESIGYIVYITSWVCPVVTVPVFSLRIYAAVRIIKRWHWDDTLMVLAVICALANSIVNCTQVRNGLGKHIVNVPIGDLRKYFMLSILGATTTYNLTVMCTKSSILLYYLRFPAGRGFQFVTYLVLLVSVGYTLSGFLSFAYSCRPMARYWNKSLDGSCINIAAGLLARAILNVITDLCILLLPIWLLWPLQLAWSKWQRASVTVVLMAGGFVVVVSSLRLAAFWTDDGVTELDHTWYYVKNTNWCLLEIWAGVFCACLPSLKCFFVHHFPGWFSGNRGNANLSMVQIPVTNNDETGAPDAPEAYRPSTSTWNLAARVRKKPSCGSSQPDLEAQGGSGESVPEFES